MKKFLLLMALSLISLPGFSGIALEEWRTHFSFNNADQVAFADGKVYVAASNKLYCFTDNNSTPEYETFSTLTGLGGHNVAKIAWCKAEKTLVVVYSDGNIDFLTSSGANVNLPDFKNKSMTADKTIHGIRIEGSNAYISTALGLMVVDVSKKEIRETYYLSFTKTYTNVYDNCVWGDSVMAATESGLYAGNLKTNLQDIEYWSAKSFVSGVTAKKLIQFNGSLLALGDNGNLYRYQGTEWIYLLSAPATSTINVQNNHLFICTGDRTIMLDAAYNTIPVEIVPSNQVAMDPVNNILYIASGLKGISKLSYSANGYSLEKDSLMPNGPASNTAWKGFFQDGSMYFTAGAQISNWGNRAGNKGDVLVFKDDIWSNITYRNAIESETKIDFLDVLNLAIDPNDSGHYFMTTWGEGLYEFRDSAFYKLHTNKNSPLSSSISGDSTHYIRVDGAAFDQDQNLWVLCANTSNPLQILLKNAEGYPEEYSKWSDVKYPSMPSSQTWNSILFTKRNQVWINALREPAGLFVLDNNSTPEDDSDDDSKWITSFTDQDGNTISPYYVNCITEDLNGAIWIGTVNGPIIANNPSYIFDNNFNFTRIKIPRNDGSDNADYLLNDIRINCITVDGANRKWIGTHGNGVYLISADGLETIHHFESANSPLPSNYVWSITVDPESGEVFFGTESGLVSYRSDAIQGKISFQNIHVFPNPVTSSFEGKITVTGLMENSQVSISDLAGNVVTKGTSLGGQFVWDGYTVQGKKAASGVYLVFATSEDGANFQSCKFMIVR